MAVVGYPPPGFPPPGFPPPGHPYPPHAYPPPQQPAYPPAYPPPFRPAPPAPPAEPADRAALVQKLLLIAGALCVVGAASVFLAVSWHSMGLAGQVAVALLVTAAFAAGGVVLSRRGLPMSAEAFAGTAAVLIVADLGAAHRFDLLGLGTLDSDAYLAIAHLLAVPLMLGLAAVTKRTQAYLVAAVLLGALAVTEALSALSGQLPESVLIAVALTAAFTLRTATPQLAERSRAAGLSAAICAGLLAGLAILHGLEVAVQGAVLGDGGACAFVLAVVGVFSLLILKDRTATGRPAEELLAPLAGAISGALAVLAVWAKSPLTSSSDLMALQALVVAGVLAALAVRNEAARSGYAALAATAFVSAAGLAGLDREQPAVALALLPALALGMVVLAAALRAGRPEEETLNIVAATCAPLVLGQALMAQVLGHEWVLAAVLAAFGVALLGNAAVTGRTWMTAAGAGALAAAALDLAYVGGVRLVEAYTLPLAAIAGTAGYLAWRKDRGASSWTVTGPALTIGLGGSTLAIVYGDGNLARTVLVLAGAVGVVLAGLAARMAAPIVIGALSAASVAVSQLAPYAVEVPRWVSLGLAGFALLAIGIGFEQARTTARDARRWFAELS